MSAPEPMPCVSEPAPGRAGGHASSAAPPIQVIRGEVGEARGEAGGTAKMRAANAKKFAEERWVREGRSKIQCAGAEPAPRVPTMDALKRVLHKVANLEEAHEYALLLEAFAAKRLADERQLEERLRND
jgi:hypothetical protein